MVEGHACEISARQTAMDNASKNAGEMIDKFNLLYNRTRQAVITNGNVNAGSDSRSRRHHRWCKRTGIDSRLCGNILISYLKT